MWSFVHDKSNKQWLWLAVLRRTRQVVAFHIGNRGYTAFEELYAKVPLEYKKCQSRSDFWKVYDLKWYNDLRDKYHANDTFPTIYEKTKVSEKYKPSIWRGIWNYIKSPFNLRIS